MITLLLFARRALADAKGRLLLIGLILAMQTAALGGSYLAQESLHETRDRWATELGLADLDVRFVPASAEEMPSEDALERLPGVRAVTRRFLSLGYIEKNDGSHFPVLVQYVDPGAHPAVDDVRLLAGRWLEPGKPDLAVADRSFAGAQGIKLGDEIVLNPRRLTSRFRVEGIGLSAEHLIPTANPDRLVPTKGSLGVLYASRESLDRSFPDRLYNDVVVTFAPGADPRATTDAVLAALGKFEIESVTPKTAPAGYRFLDVILAGTRSVIPTIAGIIAIMAAIVSLVSLQRLVAERRTEIGVLLAQGYAPAQIAACFFGLGLVPGVGGGFLGIPAAAAFARAVAQTTASTWGMPDPIITWSPRWFALAAGSAVLVGLVSAVPPTLAVFRTTPSMSLRGTGELEPGAPSAFVRWISGRSTSMRYALRNVVRRMRVSLAVATLVALGVALPSGLLTSISSWDSWARLEASTFRWDAVASFKVPLTESNVEELFTDKGVATWETYVQGYAPVKRANGETDGMRVRGVAADGHMAKDSTRLTDGRWFEGDDAAEAIVNTNFMGSRALRVGDKIAVVHEGVAHEVRVVGLVKTSAFASMMVPRGTARAIFDLQGRSSGAYLVYGDAPVTPSKAPAPKPVTARNAEITDTIDIEDTAPKPVETALPAPFVAKTPTDALLGEELVTNVDTRAELTRATLTHVASFKILVVPFIALSAVLVCLFVVGVLGFLLLERETEYATLRSMGYGASEVTSIILVEIAMLGVLGLVMSLGVWALVAHALGNSIANTWFSIPLDFRALDFAAAAVPTFLLLGCGAIPGIRSLMRLDLTLALRRRALG